MKNMFRLTVGVLTTGTLALGVPAQAINSTGPYYAEPSWDQKLPASTRFVVLSDWNNNAVLDRETGLVWEKSPDATTHIWNQARFQCSSRTTGGRKGWRLPSVHELASLVDPSVAPPGPTLPPGHPFLNLPPASTSSLIGQHQQMPGILTGRCWSNLMQVT